MSYPVLLQRTYRFCCAHRYHNPDWSAAENQRVFGKCNYEYGHGHNYVLTVALGPAVPRVETGMVYDLGALDALVDRLIIQQFDHHHVNHAVAHFRNVVPTTEAMCAYIYGELAGALPPGVLHSVVLEEDETLSASCFGASSDR